MIEINKYIKNKLKYKNEKNRYGFSFLFYENLFKFQSIKTRYKTFYFLDSNIRIYKNITLYYDYEYLNNDYGAVLKIYNGSS
jgi:hypothetical protein